MTTCPLRIADSKATARFTVEPGAVVDFVLAYQRVAGSESGVLLPIDVGAELENTGAGWRSWSAIHRSYEGPYMEQVRRSALVLQALTYQPTGAVIAAATTSLPETAGGSDT